MDLARFVEVYAEWERDNFFHSNTITPSCHFRRQLRYGPRGLITFGAELQERAINGHNLLGDMFLGKVVERSLATFFS